jgi:hypothetical protein
LIRCMILETASLNCEIPRPNLEFLEMYVSCKLASVETTRYDGMFWRSSPS